MDGNHRGAFFDYVKKAKEEYDIIVSLHPELSELSHRELEVFMMLLTDMTLSEMADKLFVSYSSVHFHCKNIYRKLNLSSRKQLLIKYRDL